MSRTLPRFWLLIAALMLPIIGCGGPVPGVDEAVVTPEAGTSIPKAESTP